MPRALMVATTSATLRAFLIPFGMHFRTQGWTVDAMAANATTNESCIPAFDHLWDMTWSRNPLDPRNLIGTPGQLKALVEREKYDIVHVHTPVASFVTRYALRGLRANQKVRVIYTAHGFHFHENGSRLKNAIYANLEKLAGRWTDYLVVINREDEAAARKYRLVAENHLIYMPGIGVDASVYSRAPMTEAEIAQLRAEIGLKPGQRILLMIAEFIPRKRHVDLLNAFAQVTNPEVHVVFAGDGPLMDEMRQLAATLGIADRIHMLGLRSDIPKLISISEAVILPSVQEGRPRSVLEAMSIGVPVVATDIRGVRDMIDENCGLLVPVLDPDALAKALNWIVDHPQEAQAMGQRGREKVLAEYDLQHIIALHESLYARALAGQ